MKQFTPISVSWIDSTSSGGWKYGDAIRDCNVAKITTLGYFLHQTKDVIALAHSIDVDEVAAVGAIKIPRGCITSLKRVKLAVG